MKEIRVHAGASIYGAVQDLVKSAPAFCLFNDIRVEAKVGETENYVTQSYFKAIEERADAYKNSPEGKLAEQRRLDGINVANTTLTRALASLDTLDFSDIKKPMKFLYDVQDATDLFGVDEAIKLAFKNKTLEVFAKNNLTPGMCLKKNGNFDYEDPMVMAKYIIGQALSTLHTLGIHPMYCSMYEKWMKNASRWSAI